jgi:hypothetical protein
MPNDDASRSVAAAAADRRLRERQPRRERDPSLGPSRKPNGLPNDRGHSTAVLPSVPYDLPGQDSHSQGASYGTPEGWFGPRSFAGRMSVSFPPELGPNDQIKRPFTDQQWYEYQEDT